MSNVLVLPILSDLVPGGFRYGLNMVVEFDPHSLWYETSLTIAAHALGNGVRTDYHTFQHIPGEVLEALARFGLDVKKLEEEGKFRLLDTYTATTGIGVPEKPKIGRQPYQTQYPVLSNWNISAAQDMESPRTSLSPKRNASTSTTTLRSYYNTIPRKRWPTHGEPGSSLLRGPART